MDEGTVDGGDGDAVVDGLHVPRPRVTKGVRLGLAAGVNILLMKTSVRK